MSTRIPPRPAAVPARVPAGKPVNPVVAAAAPVAAAPPVAAPVAVQAPVVAPAAPPAPVVGTPAEAPAQKKRGRKPRADGGSAAGRAPKGEYPGLFAWNEDNTPVMVDDGAGGSVQQRVKLTAIPEDYSPAQHGKLRENDFSEPALFWDFQAHVAKQRAAKCEAKAKELRTFAAAGDRKAANKFLKMREQIEALRAQLRAQGVPEEMLSLSIGDEPAAE